METSYIVMVAGVAWTAMFLIMLLMMRYVWAGVRGYDDTASSAESALPHLS